MVAAVQGVAHRECDERRGLLVGGQSTFHRSSATLDERVDEQRQRVLDCLVGAKHGELHRGARPDAYLGPVSMVHTAHVVEEVSDSTDDLRHDHRVLAPAPNRVVGDLNDVSERDETFAERVPPIQIPVAGTDDAFVGEAPPHPLCHDPPRVLSR